MGVRARADGRNEYRGFRQSKRGGVKVRTKVDVRLERWKKGEG